MKKFFRYVLLTLILLGVAIASALTAMRFAIHGREVAVPKLMGKSLSAAQTAANEDGLVFQVQDHFYSKDTPEGYVLSQSPAPGTIVRRGWTLTATQSLGPQRVDIPNVVGESPRAAEINVRTRGLEIGPVATASIPGAIEDQIIAQTPAPNATSAESPKIGILVAAPAVPEEFLMPNFVGKPISEIAPLVQKVGFNVGKINGTVSNPSSSAGGSRAPTSGLIVQQTPAAGQKIISGATIFFKISK